MTYGTPASITARKESRYGSSAVVTVSTTSEVKSVFPVTRPSPGKCLTTDATPAAAIPAT